MKVRLTVLKEYVSCLLTEGRVDDAREKFPDVSEEDFEFLVHNQPTGSNNKYLMWSCMQVDEGFSTEVVVGAIRLFDGNQQRLKNRDINQYKEPGDIETSVAELGKSRGQKAAEVRSDTDTIYNDDRFSVVRPHTTEAACKYGTGTKWCIAATGSHNYYNSYSTNNNKFYFVIDKKLPATDPASKFAIAYISDRQIQVYNAPDRLVDISVVAKHVGDKWNDIWGKIQAHVKANPMTREVEDAQKATEEHVKNLLSGKTVSDQGILKIATDGKLTTPVVKAIIKHYESYSGPTDHRDPRSSIISALSNRTGQMSNDAAMMMIKWIASTRPADGGRYWSGEWQLQRMFSEANLSPADFREVAKGGDESILALIMKNPNVPEDLAAEIGAKVQGFKQAEAQRAVYWELIKSGKITTEQFKNAMEKHEYLVNMILNQPEEVKLSPEMIRSIKLHNEYQLKAFLRLPNLSPEDAADAIDRAWKTLKKYDLYDILKTANIPVSKIEQLWKDKGQDVRTALLQNPSIGHDIANKFAISKNSAYRFAIAHNPITAAEDLHLLAADESVSTRAAVGANPSTPVETLRALARDEAVVVRASVAGNAATPQNTLMALKKDNDEAVRKAARQTLKTLEVAEAYTGMRSLLLEEMQDEETGNVMTPNWRELPKGLSSQEFITVFLLQNNGSATREQIEEAWMMWPHRAHNHRRRGYRYGGYRATVGKDIWAIIKREERYGDSPTRTTTSGGKGWWWAPGGINKGALFRLTPAGAAIAMNLLAVARAKDPQRQWATHPTPAVKKSPPPRELDPNLRDRPVAAPRGPKTTYKIYGKFKGHPAATRLKGQAYVAPANTQFSAGEQAYVTPEDGKLTVKKADGDHTQTWEPIDG